MDSYSLLAHGVKYKHSQLAILRIHYCVAPSDVCEWEYNPILHMPLHLGGVTLQICKNIYKTNKKKVLVAGVSWEVKLRPLLEGSKLCTFGK